MKVTELTFRSEGVLQQIRQIEVTEKSVMVLFAKFVFRLNWLFKKNEKMFIELLHSVSIILYPIGRLFRSVILYNLCRLTYDFNGIFCEFTFLYYGP